MPMLAAACDNPPATQHKAQCTRAHTRVHACTHTHARAHTHTHARMHTLSLTHTHTHKQVVTREHASTAQHTTLYARVLTTVSWPCSGGLPGLPTGMAMPLPGQVRVHAISSTLLSIISQDWLARRGPVSELSARGCGTDLAVFPHQPRPLRLLTLVFRPYVIRMFFLAKAVK